MPGDAHVCRAAVRVGREDHAVLGGTAGGCTARRWKTAGIVSGKKVKCICCGAVCDIVGMTAKGQHEHSRKGSKKGQQR
jgi:hypothetical protein